MTAALSLRIDLPQGRIGPGKIALLEAIGREGSISAAGRALGMSYKRAWDLEHFQALRLRKATRKMRKNKS